MQPFVTRLSIAGTSQRSAAQHSRGQHSIAGNSTAQHSIAGDSTAQHGLVQHDITQHSTAQHATVEINDLTALRNILVYLKQASMCCLPDGWHQSQGVTVHIVPHFPFFPLPLLPHHPPTHQHSGTLLGLSLLVSPYSLLLFVQSTATWLHCIVLMTKLPPAHLTILTSVVT